MCNFGILLSWTSEEGRLLLKEEMAEYFSLFFVVVVVVFGGGHRLQEMEGFLHQGIQC